MEEQKEPALQLNRVCIVCFDEFSDLQGIICSGSESWPCVGILSSDLKRNGLIKSTVRRLLST